MGASANSHASHQRWQSRLVVNRSTRIKPSKMARQAARMARQAARQCGTTGPNMARQATIAARQATTVAAAYNAAPQQHMVRPRVSPCNRPHSSAIETNAKEPALGKSKRNQKGQTPAHCAPTTQGMLGGHTRSHRNAWKQLQETCTGLKAPEGHDMVVSTERMVKGPPRAGLHCSRTNCCSQPTAHYYCAAIMRLRAAADLKISTQTAAGFVLGHGRVTSMPACCSRANQPLRK